MNNELEYEAKNALQYDENMVVVSVGNNDIGNVSYTPRRQDVTKIMASIALRLLKIRNQRRL